MLFFLKCLVNRPIKTLKCSMDCTVFLTTYWLFSWQKFLLGKKKKLQYRQNSIKTALKVVSCVSCENAWSRIFIQCPTKIYRNFKKLHNSWLNADSFAQITWLTGSKKWFTKVWSFTKWCFKSAHTQHTTHTQVRSGSFIQSQYYMTDN